MVLRDFSGRFKGSFMGAAWSIISPAVMIVIFTIIFAGIFGARFGASGSQLTFAIYLFCGLLPWIAFSDGIQRATTSMIDNVNLVKRVVFPLEALPVNCAFSAILQQLLGTIVLLLAFLALSAQVKLTILWMPVLLLVQIVVTLGLAWLVASLGVFIRDMPQVNQLVLMAWMYLTPIFYPENLIPSRYGWLISMNPMAPLIRSYRNILLEGKSPDWGALGYTSIFATLTFVAGYWWFIRTRKAFADVL